MEPNTTTPTPQGNKNRSNTGLLLLVVLLLISNVAMLWMLMQRNKEVDQSTQQVETLTSEKDNVTFLLENMLASYDTLKTENEQITVEMEAQKAQVERLLDQVKRGNYDLSKAKKEAETLRKIMKGYVATIDSLNQANQALQAENVTIRQELGEVKGQKEAISTKAQELEGKIAKGSVLHTTSINAGALYMRNNGKQVETDRAKRAEMVKSCFTLGQNTVTSAGDKVLYMRVISPDGKVLPSSESNNRFKYNGVEGEFSARREVNYQNQPVDVCIFWTGSEELRTGQYIVEIYEAGALVSKANFNLK
jgi:predicted  nucleic acid-binding Zn-ribbon protein